MGFAGGSYAMPKEVIHMVEYAPKPSVFSIPGVGLDQTPIGATGITLGINVRTGMEDNGLYKKGEHCKAKLIEWVVGMAQYCGKEMAIALSGH